MEFTRCLRCMKETTGYPCPHCGYVPGEGRPKDYVLRPGTILNGKYVVGAILGQGGFGITYVGWDLALDCKVAIKEYYPSGQVVRDNSTGSVLHWLSTPQSETARDMGKEMFLKEARKMSRVRDIPQVVHVHDLFQENDTAYIIMDFVEGQTLKAHLSQPLTWEDARKIFLPAIRAMEQVHQAGLIHRDLSPDNIMLLPNGDVRILDLGAAKDLNVNSGASSMQVAKGGFSPLEQYTQRGGSGPWSDVYAMAATMYYSLTGVLPLPAMDRMVDDQLRWDLEPLKALPKPVLEALKKAMALLAKDRTQSMGEFLSQLEKATPAPDPTPDPIPSKPLLAVLAAVLVVALLAGWTLWPRQEAAPQLESKARTETTAPTEPESVFPLAIQEQTICSSKGHTVAVKRDGTVVAKGDNNDGRCNVSDWTNIVAVTAGSYHTIGLNADGTVIATGWSSFGECDVSDWSNIVAITAGGYYTVGLKANGTVVATGRNNTGQCNVSDWQDIVAVTAGDFHTVGLKADGTVVATGDTYNGQCDVSDWSDIVAVAAGGFHTIGLKTDGTVVATGVNDNGQCNISDWTDIVAVTARGNHTVGLKGDGTVVATGVNDDGQCNISDWTDIVAITTGGSHTIGLKSDGTLVVAGRNNYSPCNVSGWTDIRIPGTLS